MAWHTGLPRKLKARGVKVKVVKGWKRRGSRFPFKPIGSMFHHTASNKKGGNAPALGLVTHGSARTAPGPLCNVLIARDGTIYFVAAGKSNHAGFGGPWGRVPRDSGNAYFVGKEYENNGIGEKWNPDQLRAGEIFDELLLEHLGAKSPRRRVMGHKEYAPRRKIDPGGVDMGGHRRRVTALMQGPKPPPPKPPETVEPKPKPKPKPKPRAKPVLKQGSKGNYVRRAQNLLRDKKFYSGIIDGKFGKKTASAVRRFQKARRLKVDGVIGGKTWRALEKGGK